MRIRFRHYPAITLDGNVPDALTGADRGTQLDIKPDIRLSADPPHWFPACTARLRDDLMAGLTVFYFSDEDEWWRFMRKPDVWFDPFND